jgi:hypothetical protein
MVAHPGVDVLIPALTCIAAATAKARSRRPRGHARPAGADCRRLLAALCVKYVPKFRASTLLRAGHAHHVGETAVAPPLAVPLPPLSRRSPTPTVGAVRRDRSEGGRRTRCLSTCCKRPARPPLVRSCLTRRVPYAATDVHPEGRRCINIRAGYTHVGPQPGRPTTRSPG